MCGYLSQPDAHAIGDSPIGVRIIKFDAHITHCTEYYVDILYQAIAQCLRYISHKVVSTIASDVRART